jgi:hypothetical protein
MAASTTTPLAAVTKGLVAGALGSLAMTGYQLAVQRLRGSGSGSAPAEVGRRIVEGVLQREVPEDRMDLLNNAMHFLYGSSWGPLYGVVHSTLRPSSLRHGLTFGGLVWATSLIHLPAMRLAPPVWQYPPAEVALDLSYHLVYGLGVAGAYGLLDR